MTLHPPALRPGDEVRVVAPGGPVAAEPVERGMAVLAGWGLRPRLGRHALGRRGFLAGTDEQRAADLAEAFADPAVRGIVCARGGYGTQRVVDLLDIAAVRRDPKVVCGYSDITALHLALWRGARLATVHGPVAAWDDERTPAVSAGSLRRALMEPVPTVLTRSPNEAGAAVLVPGQADGTLLGGNLTVLAASVGTADLPDLTGAILLIEEIGEPPYRVDRLLTQLRRAGALDGLAGVALGQFTGCADRHGVDVAEVLTERLGDLGVPVLGGLPLGHGQTPRSVGLGVPANVDAAAGTLLVSPAVR
ncbi:LD-carboxypeptidase [Solwaraspora sp. WMMD792]|uniref:S66 peptidase family protein n=1 Tax=Solwaraspora sp. WMMD792 TaxID=3016099 RepID=UPI00241608FD|nr:LD-carboxypeptidase [Solwaraspora sp. WMMD792]MDG4772129.1 LD-carboxypeptidase [Solwaraspora sp. WMMD792]